MMGLVGRLHCGRMGVGLGKEVFLFTYVPNSMTTLQSVSACVTESRFRICAQIVDIACWMYVVG